MVSLSATPLTCLSSELENPCRDKKILHSYAYSMLGLSETVRKRVLIQILVFVIRPLGLH